ncbi:triacylglycerol lipase OBL1 [Gossypium raimondii]|uniref:Fungal lipase-type domain-containing protein n=1 Tax=Gossypium raimondii TaxID=29730 RepID=A0A0D2RIL5_GOSRA|nr:triacylglycerol lipase OBL1 [Gossypium raimondii]KJB29466.1 hypothetical protein B456_005G102200 [Gossypium raimondii]
MASNKNRFYDDCFIINSEKASYLDLLGLLVSSKLKQRRFIDAPEQHNHRFRRRLVVFGMVLLQKLLSLVRIPLALTEIVVVTLLNLLTYNGGLSGLLLNLMKGKLVWPEKSSEMYRSMLGNVDTRVELDNNIKPGDPKYKALLSMMASKLSYENEAFIKTVIIQHWKMKFLKFYSFWNDFEERSTTQAFMMQDTQSNPNLIVVAFRGTQPFSAYDWKTNVDISWYELKDMGKGKIHSGFMKALGMQKTKGWPKEIQQSTHQNQFAYYTLRQKLREVLQENQDARLIVTGHSLGSALAVLFVAVLMLHEEEWLLEKLEAVYTFGQPRVGDHKFGEFMIDKLRKFDVKYFRYVYSNDMVARIPPDDDTFLSKHFGPCFYFNSFYNGKVLSEEPNKNYFSWLWEIPKRMIAVWELIRAFILPYMKGPEYKENWVMITLRIMGLVTPGMSAHMPQDYVNSIRLGTLPSVHQLKRD